MGSILVRTASHRGRRSRGNTAPDRKNIGSTMKFMTTWNVSTWAMRAAMTVPNAVRVKARSAISATSVKRSVAEYGTCTRPQKSSITAPWQVATVAPPRHLPRTRALRRTGATSISRRKPNSRSQTIDSAEKMAVNSTVMPRTPGKMNVR